MSLKIQFKIFVLLVSVTFIACKKDEKIAPYKEYRDPYEGSYFGLYLSFDKVFHPNVGLYEPYDSIYFPNNYLVTVKKTTSYKDSSLVLNYFGIGSTATIKNFKIKGNGKYSSYSSGKQGAGYSITFRNDSLYIYEHSYNNISPLSYYSHNTGFIGTKQ